MRKLTQTILILTGLSLLTSAAHAAEGRIPISSTSNRTITSPGSYILTEDLPGGPGSGDGITIESDDVSIDLDRHTITANEFPLSDGIFSVGYTNIHISNGTIKANEYGVTLTQPNGNFHVNNLTVTVLGPNGTAIEIRGDSTATAHGVVKDCVLSGPSGSVGYGIFFGYARGLIEGNEARSFYDGIWIENANNLFVEKNIVTTNNTGIAVVGSSNNMIRNNSASQNSAYGIHVSLSTYNTITSNTASGNATRGIYVAMFSDYNNLGDNTTSCATGVGLDIATCGNIYSNNKAPGDCTISVASCATPNIDGGGNTP